MLLPTGAASFTEAMKIGTETYHTLKKVINAKYGIDGKFCHLCGCAYFVAELVISNECG